MKFSIIIPYYNREYTIERCLKSIGKEDKNTSFEIIVVDDNSKIPFKTENHSIKVIRLEENKGPVAARSFGLNIASGEYVIFLDSDDELISEWGQVVNMYCEKREFQIIAFPDICYKGPGKYTIEDLDAYWKWTSDKDRASDYLLCIRRECLVKVGMPQYRVSEIWFISNLFLHGLKALYTNAPLFIYHQDSGNQLSKSGGIKFLRSNYEKASVSKSIYFFNQQRKFIKVYNKLLLKAWSKRLLKESFLTVDTSIIFKYFKTYIDNGLYKNIKKGA